MLKLKKITDQYFSHFSISQKSMAASPSSIEFCLNFINQTKPDSILDAGSGYSSLAFHSIHKNVKTIDDNQIWGNQTSQIINRILKKTVKIDSIHSITEQKFDFVFYDYGDIETRIYYFQLALYLCRSAMYLDDMHINFYKDYIFSRAKQFKLINLKKETIDEFGRFGYLLIKKNLILN